jgi:hypothetical protein
MDCDCCPVQGKAWPPCCPSALATRNTGPCAGWPASPGGAQADGRGTVGQGAGWSMHDEPAATYCQYSASMVLFLQGLRPPACSSCRACAHHRSQASASALSAVVLCLVCLRLFSDCPTMFGDAAACLLLHLSIRAHKSVPSDKTCISIP